MSHSSLTHKDFPKESYETTRLLRDWAAGDRTALDELARVDECRARVVEMRYFGGLSVEETAAVLGVSP